MAHFKTEKWIDYMNQAVTAEESERMEAHLKQGCKRCEETVSIWQKVQRSAAMERSYHPPADTVRLAKAAFVGAGSKAQRRAASSRIQVLFDSFLQPAFAGARSAGCGIRQMLYRADPFQIDLQLEARPGGNRVLVTGQLLHLDKPEVAVKDTRVVLSNMRGQVIYTAANQFGEFSGEVENSGDLQLTFANPGGTPIVISLQEALGNLPKEKA
jgi:hypothetical protein